MKTLELVWQKVPLSVTVKISKNLFKDLQHQIEKLDNFTHVAQQVKIYRQRKTLMSAVLYLHEDEELIEEAMNGSNDNNEEDDDGDVVLGPIVPKLVMFRMYCKCCMIIFSSV